MATIVNPVDDYDTNPELDKFEDGTSWEDNRGIKVDVYPKDIDVGSIGASTPQIPITVKNNSYTYALSIEGFKAVGDVSIATVNGIEYNEGATYTVQPNSSLQFTIKMHPNASGILSGGVFIETLDAAGSEFVAVKGTSDLSAAQNFNLDVVALANNILRTSVDYLELKNLITISYLYDSENEILYYSSKPITGTVVEISDNIGGDVTITTSLGAQYTLRDYELIKFEQQLETNSRIFIGSNRNYVQNGDDIPEGTTHLRILVSNESIPTIVAMSSVANGTVSLLTETGATIGSTSVTFISLPFKGQVTPQQFGVNGIADDTAFNAFINYCDSTNTTPLFPAGTVIKLTGTDDIVFDLPYCNFNNATIDLEHYEGILIFKGKNSFVEYFPNSAVVDNLVAEGTLSGRVFSGWDGVSEVADSFVKIETSQDYYRYRETIQKRKEFNRSLRSGYLTSKLKYDLDASYITKVSVMKMADTYQVFENLKIHVGSRDIGDDFIMFENVTLGKVRNMRFIVDDIALTTNPSLIRMFNCAEIDLDGIYLQWAINTNDTTFTYNLNMEDCYGVRINGLDCDGLGWGSTGNNDCARVEFSKCKLSRLDFHRPFREFLKISDCDIGDKSISVSGIGDLHIKDTRTNTDNNIGPIDIRYDVGFVDGDLYVDNLDHNGRNAGPSILKNSNADVTFEIPAGSPLKFTTFNNIYFKNIKSTKRLNLALEIANNTASMPKTIRYEDIEEGVFIFQRNISNIPPNEGNTDDDFINSTPNLDISLENVKLSEVDTYQLQLNDLTVDHYCVSMSLKNVRGDVDGVYILPHFFGKLYTENTDINGINYFSGANLDKPHMTTIHGGKFRFKPTYAGIPFNGAVAGSDKVKCSITGADLSHGTSSEIIELCFATLTGCRFWTSSADYKNSARSADESTNAVSFTTTIPDYVSTQNRVNIVTGYGTSVRKTPITLPEDSLSSFAWVTSTEHITITRNGSTITVSNPSGLDFRYFEIG